MGRERNSSPSLPPSSPVPSRILRTLRTPRTPRPNSSSSFQQTTPSAEKAMSIEEFTPSTLLSRDMDMLGLSSGTRRTTPGTPSIRMVDSRKQVAPNSSLPFERLGLLARNNSPRGSNSSSAPYPPRVKAEKRRYASSPATTTATTRPRLPLSSSCRPALMALPTMVVDEEENPFMTTVPAPKTPTTTDLMMDPFQEQEAQLDMTMLDEEDPLSAALMCSPGSEKENLTPKALSELSSSQRPEAPIALAPPPVCRAGPITRSRRAALGAISPRLWNTYGPDPSLLLSKESLKKAALAAFSTKTKSDSGSSSSVASTSASCSNDNTQISDEDAAAIRRVIECEIEPQRVAFNRQAQKVAGQIFHWHHGEYRLVDEKERQNWPSEWKFDVFKDPETSAGGQRGPTTTTATTIMTTSSTKGKGKMVDSAGSVPKRARHAREPLGSMTEL